VHIRGGIQNIPDWFHHQYSSCGSAKHRSQRPNCEFRVLLRRFAATVAPKFGEKGPGCFTMTTPSLTLPSSPSSFWRNTKWLSSPTHRTPLIWHPVTSSYLQKLNKLKGRRFDTTEEIQAESHWVLDSLREKDFQEPFQKLRRRWDRCLHAGGIYFKGVGGRYTLWWVLFLQRQCGILWNHPRTGIARYLSMNINTNTTIILPAALYMCKTCSLTLRGED
jgi:hypothetical protein